MEVVRAVWSALSRVLGTRLIGALILLALLVPARAAAASPLDPVTNGTLYPRLPPKPAKLLAAKDAFLRGEYEEVLRQHRSIQRLEGGPAFDALAALAHDRLRHYQNAHELLRKVARSKEGPPAPAWVGEMLDLYNAPRASVWARDPITRLEIDGIPAAIGLRHELLPGPHVVRVHARNADEAITKSIDLKPREAREIVLDPTRARLDELFSPREEPTPPPPAALPPVAEPAAPVAHASKRTGDVVVDGRLDEAFWTSVPPMELKTQKAPDEGRPPSERTHVRIVYDESHVYFAFECTQRISPLVTKLTTQDDIDDSDSIEIDIAARSDRRSAAFFSVNASGVRSDGFRGDDGELSLDWDALWEAGAVQTKDGYTVEVKIPLSALELTKAGSQSWALQLRRYIAARLETDEWAYIPRTDGSEVARYGELDGLDVSPRTQFELVPYVGGGITRSDDDPLAPGRIGHRFVAGGDLTWKPNRSITLAAAINPDFSQVRAEQVLLNLGNTEIRLPERRPFFLQGLALFQPVALKEDEPAALLYTRRIGARPDGPSLRESEVVVRSARATTVLGATKSVITMGDHSIGAFIAVTDQNEARTRRLAGEEDRLLEAATAFSLLRWQYTLSDLRIGATIGSTNRFESLGGRHSQLGPDTTCPDGSKVARGARCFADAYVAGTDLRATFADKAYYVDVAGYSSVLNDGQPRIVRDGSVIHGGDVGVGGRVRAGRQSGEHWLWQVYGFGATRKLDLNDLGYLSRGNILRTGGELNYRVLSPTRWAREIGAFVGGNLTGNGQLSPLDRSTYLGGRITSEAGHVAEIELGARLPFFDDREVGNGTALQRTGRASIGALATTNRQATFSADLMWQQEVFAGGTLMTGSFGIRARPTAFAILELVPSATYTAGEPRFVSTSEDQTAYVFSRLTVRSVDATARIGVSITPRISFDAFARAFAVAASYGETFTSPTGSENVRVELDELRPSTRPAFLSNYEDVSLLATVVASWEYAAGSRVQLIFTRTQTAPETTSVQQRPTLDFLAGTRGPANDMVLLKVSYAFR